MPLAMVTTRWSVLGFTPVSRNCWDGFTMNPEKANLYNKEGIPAGPFRTDSW